MIAPSAPNRILVVQLRRLGDVILTTPAVAALKNTFPRARIDFLVESPGAEALANNPAIDELMLYDARTLVQSLAWIRRIRARRYDWLIDFLANPRTALLSAFSGAPLRAGPAHVRRHWAYNRKMLQSETTVYAGLEKIRWLKELGVSEDAAPPLPKLYLANRPACAQDIIGMAPASRQITRRWPARSFAALGRLLHRTYSSQIAIFWGPGESALAQEIVDDIGAGAALAPETRSIGELATALSRCRLLVTNCSGTKHVAVGVGVPTLTIHGSSDPAAWTPAHPSHQFVRLESLSCIGCRSNTCAYHLECMMNLTPESVMAAVGRLLSKTEARS